MGAEHGDGGASEASCASWATSPGPEADISSMAARVHAKPCRNRVVSQFEFLSAVRGARRATKQERTSTESSHRRLNRWPPDGAAAGGRRRMARHHQARRGGGRVDTHRQDRHRSGFAPGLGCQRVSRQPIQPSACEARGYRRPKLHVVDVAIEGLAQSVDKFCHAAYLLPGAGATNFVSARR